MEIIFNKLSYSEKKSSRDFSYLSSVDMVLDEGKIYSIIGEKLNVIGNLLMVIKRPSSGELIMDGVKIKRTSHINNINELRKKIGFVSLRNNKFVKKTVKEEIKEYMNNYKYKSSNSLKHISDSLKMVGLNETYLDEDPKNLSLTLQKRLLLACILSYNPDVIVLDAFSKGFNYREKEYFKKLFMKLKTKFNKTIIILEDKLEFGFNLVDKVYVINKGKLVIGDTKEIFYEDELYDYVEMPKIIDFTKYCHSKGHNINNYTDFKELIKELYRNVR